MRDLDQIAELNAQSVADTIPRLRANGKWVIGIYAGLNFEDAKPFDTEGQARTEIATLEGRNIPGRRYQLLEPTGVPGQGLLGEVKALNIDQKIADGNAQSDTSGANTTPDGSPDTAASDASTAGSQPDADAANTRGDDLAVDLT